MIEDKTRRTSRLPRRGGIGRPSVDVQRLGKAISGPGIDTRTWLVAGTVGVVDDQGEFKTDDPQAVFVDRLGAVVSVRLEPSGDVVTARYNGVACGRYGFILVPIKPGDEVLVAVPGGDFNSAGVAVVAIQSNQTAQVPADWNNDRVLIDLNVPLEIRGPAVSIKSALLALNNRPVFWSGEGV